MIPETSDTYAGQKILAPPLTLSRRTFYPGKVLPTATGLPVRQFSELSVCLKVFSISKKCAVDSVRGICGLAFLVSIWRISDCT
jgi:hypothetical protein